MSKICNVDAVLDTQCRIDGAPAHRMAARPRIAVVVSHPIQHFCPQYASIARSTAWDFKVFFASTMGAKPYEDKGLQKTVQWGNLYLDEFDHTFLNDRPLPSSRKLDASSIDEELAAFSPDVVIVYGYSQRFSRRARRWTAKNARLIYYISDSETHRREGIVRRMMKAAILPPLFKSINRFLSVGNANEFYYVRHGVDTQRITRMNFPIDIRLYDRAFESRNELRANIRSKLGFDEDTFVLSIVGKLIDLKKQRDAIAAVSTVNDRRVKLIVVGSGPIESSLRRYADEVAPGSVSFVGFIPPNELPAYYAASDVYVQSSLYDRHSLAVSEAIYFGLPVIMSSTCGSYGPHDDVQPGRNGFVYPFGDVKKLAERICQIAEDPIRLRRFAEASRRYAVGAQQRAHGVFLEESLISDSLL